MVFLRGGRIRLPRGEQCCKIRFPVLGHFEQHELHGFALGLVPVAQADGVLPRTSSVRLTSFRVCKDLLLTVLHRPATLTRWDPLSSNRVPPTPHRRRSWANDSSIIPSPCTDDGFSSPIYEVSNPRLEVHQPQYDDDLPVRKFNFRLRDLANNYTMNCTWGPVDMVYQIYWFYSKCVTEDGSEVDDFMHRNLFKMKVDNQLDKNLSISQIWVCEPKNGAYP